MQESSKHRKRSHSTGTPQLQCEARRRASDQDEGTIQVWPCRQDISAHTIGHRSYVTRNYPHPHGLHGISMPRIAWTRRSVALLAKALGSEDSECIPCQLMTHSFLRRATPHGLAKLTPARSRLQDLELVLRCDARRSCMQISTQTHAL